jgi:hypothetical protein
MKQPLQIFVAFILLLCSHFSFAQSLSLKEQSRKMLDHAMSQEDVYYRFVEDINGDQKDDSVLVTKFFGIGSFTCSLIMRIITSV